MARVTIKAEIAGRVCALPSSVGGIVKRGEDVAIIEAMKMEIPVASPVSGKIEAILVSVDDVVTEGQALLIIDN
jgi:biotin carboxyl carrier protein